MKALHKINTVRFILIEIMALYRAVLSALMFGKGMENQIVLGSLTRRFLWKRMDGR